MTDSLPSDHPTVRSHRVHLESVGRTGRLRVALPPALDVGAEDVVCLFLDGDATHAAVAETLGGSLAVSGAFDNARLARTEGEGTDRLREWVEASGLAAGDPIALDVVTGGYAYGLRSPGDRIVYRPPDPPADSLRDIAADLDG